MEGEAETLSVMPGLFACYKEPSTQRYMLVQLSSPLRALSKTEVMASLPLAAAPGEEVVRLVEIRNLNCTDPLDEAH